MSPIIFQPEMSPARSMRRSGPWPGLLLRFNDFRGILHSEDERGKEENQESNSHKKILNKNEPQIISIVARMLFI